MILTSTKNNHIAPNNRTLTVAKTKKVRRAPYRVPKRIVPRRTKENQNQAGGFSYKPRGMNWPMPPRIINPPTARLTSRLCNKVFLRSAFKAQKPLRSRAKEIAAKDDRIQGKTKYLFSSYSGDGRGVEGSAGGGEMGVKGQR